MGAEDVGTTSIRVAVLDDADSIARVHATSWRETYGRLVADPDTNPWFDVGRRIRMWRSNLQDESFTADVAVAVDGTGVVGFAAAQATADRDAVRPEELTMLYVLARAHGSGAGQSLLDAVLADVRPRCGWRRTIRALARSTDAMASNLTAPSRRSGPSAPRYDSSAEHRSPTRPR
ncbi:GNAT family N-acetyltransferase [Amycolatopsis jiangsuensis]|uniref:L-amino acid N-acyltransferase YncA n=1 Tax=Amycolatopsis jiangsuensis TaxID=1181879 RepID=A0A840IPQ8_9PSEU|nr:GNAT family N-acetyltransferase [Amycolatopsis jiangsuensis]MBB4683910.1 L-amino acid N-acyltransferase YncA [Amycolatopsis jiangsuensis]